MRNRRLIVAGAALMTAAGAALAQSSVGSAFTYQGQLKVSGQLGNAGYDMQFALFDSATGGNQIGPTLTPSGVAVVGGLFTQTLDFGASAFNGYGRWLEIGVRPAGQAGAYTVLTPRQALTPAPYARGLALPYSGTFGTIFPLVGLNQTSTGDGVDSTTTIGTALYGQTGSGIGVWGYNLGASGNAGLFRNESVLNTAPALRVETNGGNAGDFQVQASGGSGSAVSAQTVGTGNAGSFVVNNAASFGWAVVGATNGAGASIAGLTTGTGRAGQFVILNSANPSPALEASTNGTGPAGKFTGPMTVAGPTTLTGAVDVTGNTDVAGSLTTTYGNGGQHRAAPIAFGSFGLYANQATMVSSSGNVTLSYLGNDLYRVNVSGGSNSASWVVVASVEYSNPSNPAHVITLQQGIPNGSGQVQFYAPCTSGCGTFTSETYQVSFVIYQP